MDKILKHQLSNYEIKNYMNKFNKSCHIYTYRDLLKFKSLNNAFNKKNYIFLLFEIKLNNGHWTLLIRYKNKIRFFDSYGFKPDDELTFTNYNFRKKYGMCKKHLVRLLLNSKKKIYYNNYKLQKSDININTCGYWCLMRAYFKNLNDKKFKLLFENKKYNKDKTCIIFFSIINYLL